MTHRRQAVVSVALAPVLIIALMVLMWAIAFELERRFRHPDLSAVYDAMLREQYSQALDLISRYRAQSDADEIALRKARAQCLSALGSHDGAVVQYQWLIGHDEANAAAYHFRIAELSERQHQHDVALAHYMRAGALGHAEAPAHVSRLIARTVNRGLPRVP